MNAPRIPFSFSFISTLTEGFRLFVVVSIVSSYGLVLYELFPEILFDMTSMISYFVIPMGALGGIMIGIPRLIPAKSTPKPAAPATGDDLLNEIISTGGSQELVQVPENTPETEIQEETEENTEKISADKSLEGLQTIDEDEINDMIDQKFEPVEKDLSSFKKDLNKIKEDMKTTKENVDSLTESFEGALTDMKAFQAEIANPLNFMRKYFESIDLKNLSDPSLPLKQTTGDVKEANQALPQQSVMNQSAPLAPAQSAQLQSNYSSPPSQPGYNTPMVPAETGNSQSTTQTSAPGDSKKDSKPTEMQKIESGTDLDNPMDSVMKPLFSGRLSVSNLMSIIELAGDMLKENGDDCIELLVEQCKLMGLKEEDESTIYNIIDMLKKSGMDVDDTLMQLYKFSKIVGINDKESDTHYAKLMASKRKSEDTQ